MEMRVENDLRTAAHRPPHGLRVSPTFMADRDPKGYRAAMEDLPAGTVGISALLRGIELDFVLESRDCPVCINNQRSGVQLAIDDALCAQDYRNLCRRRGLRNCGPSSTEERSVGRRHVISRSSIPGNKALRKADEVGSFERRFGDGLAG
jgi:hypothetical protein